MRVQVSESVMIPRLVIARWKKLSDERQADLVATDIVKEKLVKPKNAKVVIKPSVPPEDVRLDYDVDVGVQAANAKSHSRGPKEELTRLKKMMRDMWPATVIRVHNGTVDIRSKTREYETAKLNVNTYRGLSDQAKQALKDDGLVVETRRRNTVRIKQGGAMPHGPAISKTKTVLAMAVDAYGGAASDVADSMDEDGDEGGALPVWAVGDRAADVGL